MKIGNNGLCKTCRVPQGAKTVLNYIFFSFRNATLRLEKNKTRKSTPSTPRIRKKTRFSVKKATNILRHFLVSPIRSWETRACHSIPNTRRLREERKDNIPAALRPLVLSVMVMRYWKVPKAGSFESQEWNPSFFSLTFFSDLSPAQSERSSLYEKRQTWENEVVSHLLETK